MKMHLSAERAGARQRSDVPLSEYAIIGDGLTAALVARDGSIDWLCYGRFDGAAVFCRLLDAEQGGYFQVAPSTRFRATRRYVGRSNVLETEFDCFTGKVRLTDAMPFGPNADSTLLRKADGIAGSVSLRVDFIPTFDFAPRVILVRNCGRRVTAAGLAWRQHSSRR